MTLCSLQMEEERRLRTAVQAQLESLSITKAQKELNKIQVKSSR